ncbi:MAG: Gfo/Idh/MocA family protein [Omnitrophica WOR_2 bacterium]
MSAQALRWGILSTARINRSLIPPIKKSRFNQLTAVASRNLEKAQAYAMEWGIPKAFGSYEEMLADKDIDVIYNPLPNSLHAEWTIRAVQAGKHVLCEKPLALTVNEVDAIREAAEKAGKIAVEGFMYRHHLQTMKVKELLDNGTIGNLRYVRGYFSYKLSEQGDVRLDRELGGGSIWDIGCYPISYARYLIGEEPVSVFGWQVVGPSGVDLTFVGQLLFPNQVIAQFDSSFDAPFRAYIEVVGSEGVIQVPHPYKPDNREKIRLIRGDRVEEIAVHGLEVYQSEVEDLSDAVINGKAPRVSLADSRGNTAAIVALLESARSGSPILMQ